MAIGRDLQGSIFGLKTRHNVFEFSIFLPELGHLLPQCRVLSLEEGRPHCDLVLLQTPGITGALGCNVVLLAPLPVFVVLK